MYKLTALFKHLWGRSAKICSLFLIFGAASMQGQLTLQECQQLAHDHYPMIARTDLIASTAQYSVENIARGFLPQISLNAQGTYQNDATNIDMELAGVRIERGLNKGQYRAMVEVNQRVYDGGIIRNQKELQRAQEQSQQQSLEVDLYAIQDRINQLYFGVLLLDEQLTQNRLMIDDLNRTAQKIDAMKENGTANESDRHSVQVELLKQKQSRCELESAQKIYVETLAQFIGRKISNSGELVKPAASLSIDQDNRRMELNLFDLKAKELDEQLDLIKAKNRPTLGLFIDGGFGNPGYNMLKSGLSGMWMGGVRLSWNFGTLYTQKNEKRLVNLSKRDIEVERSTFLFNNRMEVIREDENIRKMRQLSQDDDQIVRLSEEICTASEAKMSNGTYTVNDYLTDLTKLDVARRNRAAHDLQLLQSQYNRKYILNN